MRLIFAGTPAFATRALERLLDAGHDVALVLTQPDRPAGRGQRSSASAVKSFALARSLPLEQPSTLRDDELIDRLRELGADAFVVTAYGSLIPAAALEVARHGALNIHASLLPRWRGAAPIHRALLAGDGETGVSIMKMDAGLDTGPVFAQRRTLIGPDDDCGTLHERLAELGADALLQVLTAIAQGAARASRQPEAGVTYARKIEKAETRLDWRRPALELERAVRAFRPVPGANTCLAGEALKIWRARPAPGACEPGAILERGGELRVACGEGALVLEELQPAGARRMSAAEFLRGRRLGPGARFE
ncbi:MAG: methionyl-tRNA formyltransferase [Burkholderiales bacterium]